MRLKSIAMAGTIALSSLNCHADGAPSIALYVVPGIFFDDSAPGSAGSSSKIDPAFRQSIDITQSVALLEQQAHVHFSNLASTIDSKNRLRALALSVQVTRASQYRVDKTDGTTDVYLPVTLSVYLSNPVSGEVLQSFSQTQYEELTVSRSLPQAQVASMISDGWRKGFSAVLSSTLTNAASQFNPYVVETRVTDTWRGFVILDKGYQSGIGKGDVMDSADAEVRVEYAGQNYAVAVPVLGKPDDGMLFSRPGTMALSDVKKPRVLALVSEGNADLSDAVSTQLFTDKLGSNAPFAMLPLNANFSRVQDSIDRNTTIGHGISGNRAFPDYFIRMVIPPARHYELPTNLSYKTRQSFQAWAFAELLSRDGRVLYSTDVNERIDDTVTDGSGFSPAARKEVVLKNALTELADRFGKDVRFNPVKLEVTGASGDSFEIDDPGMNLQTGDSIRVYHSAGHVRGSSENVLIPTWDASVVTRNGNVVTASTVLPVAGTPSKPADGDMILVDSVAGAGKGAQRVAFCPVKDGQLGSVSLDHFNMLAYASAARSPIMMVNPDLASLVKDRVNGQSGFSSTLELRPATYDRCLEALDRIDPKEQKCDDGVCASSYSVRLGYRETSAGTVLKQAILQHGFSTNGYPGSASAADIGTLQAVDLDADTRASLDDVMKQLLNSN